MSRVKDEYQKQIDAFCEKNIEISAQDILNRAKNQPGTEEKVVEFKSRKSKSMVWKAAIPAVLCFLLVGTTTVAATGHLSDWFRKLFKDEKTAEIIDAGYYQNMDLVAEDDTFEVRIIGVSGDTHNAQVALEIYVKDESLTDKNDEIYLEAYCMSKSEYENNLEGYAPWEAYGYRDEVNKNLYHVKLRTGMWIANGENCVLEIVKIRLGGDGLPWRTRNVSLKYELQVEANSFYQSEFHYADFAPFEYKGRTYSLLYVICGYYETEIVFRNMDVEKPDAGEMRNYGCTEEEYEDWLEFIQQVVLVVDGVEYKVVPGKEHFPFYEYNEYEKRAYTHMHPSFPSFIYKNATSVEVRCGDAVYKVK